MGSYYCNNDFFIIQVLKKMDKDPPSWSVTEPNRKHNRENSRFRDRCILNEYGLGALQYTTPGQHKYILHHAYFIRPKMKLWPIPQDLDDDISMILSAEHKGKDHYRYDIIKITYRDKNHGQKAKAIQLLSMKGEESPQAWIRPGGPTLFSPENSK